MISTISCCSALFTLVIVYKASSRLKAEYRKILLAQLALAFYGCLLIIIISPSFLLPYPVIFLTGPLTIDYRITLYLSSLVVMLYFFPTMMLLSFGLIYNFMSLKQLSSHLFKISIDRLMKIVIFSVTMILLIGNLFLITQLSGEKEQVDMQKEIVNQVDSRCAKIFQNYAAFIFDIHSWPVLVASIETVTLAILSVIFCIILTVLSCKHFKIQKPTLSAAAARNHRMMLYMLISYVAHFLVYFSFPLTAFTVSIYMTKPFLGSLTFLLIMSPAHFLGISLSVTYCVIITPYRKVVIAILVILTCTHSPNLDGPNRPTLSLSTIDNLVRRTSYRISNQVSSG